MIRLVYEAAGRQILLEDGERIPAGGKFTVSDERAAQLLADPLIPVRIADGDLRHLQRSELDELAADAGVPEPEDLPNKAAVIAALTSQREADSGEAHLTSKTQQEV